MPPFFFALFKTRKKKQSEQTTFLDTSLGTVLSEEGENDKNRSQLKVQNGTSCNMSYPERQSIPIMKNKCVSTPPQKCLHAKRNINWQTHAEKSSLILVSIVLLFITTHSYRIALKMYDVLMPQRNTMENCQRCISVGRLV